MKGIASLVLVGIMSLALFGVVAMAHSMEHGAMGEGCMASVLDSATCPPDSIAMTAHHVSAYHAFSDALVVAVMSLCSLVLFLAAALTLVLQPRAAVLRAGQRAVDRWRRRKPIQAQATGYILTWLSLLECSPSPRVSA